MRAKLIKHVDVSIRYFCIFVCTSMSESISDTKEFVHMTRFVEGKSLSSLKFIVLGSSIVLPVHLIRLCLFD